MDLGTNWTLRMHSGNRIHSHGGDFLSNIVLEILGKKRNKSHPDWIIKVPLFTEDMILYMDSLKNLKRILQQINKYSEAAGQKINIQKSILFLYTSKNKSESDVMKTTPYKIRLKRITYFKINLTWEIQENLNL